MDISPFIAVSILSCFVLGFCLGSFATALIWRGERGRSWVREGGVAVRSCCPQCGHRLGARDLVPLFSWLWLRGKCRFCKGDIPAFYPLVEIVVMVLTVTMFWAWGFSWGCVFLLLGVPFLVAAVVIDWREMILPDDINLALFALAGLHVGFQTYRAEWDWNMAAEHIAAAIVLPAVFWCASYLVRKWKGREALGMGDMKFLPSVGLFLGMVSLPSYMIVSGVLGVLTGLIKAKNGTSSAFPFGPALIVSLYLHLILTGLGFH